MNYQDGLTGAAITSSRRTSDSTEDSGIRSYLRDDIRDDHIEALHWHNSPGPL